MKSKNKIIKKIFFGGIALMTICFSGMMVGCANQNPDNPPKPGEETVTPDTPVAITVEDMLAYHSHTVYTNLTNKLYGNIPNNVWWTIDHDNDKTVTKITARYILSETNEIYSWSLTKNLTCNEIINNSDGFKNIALFNEHMTYKPTYLEANKAIVDAAISKKGINVNDILLIRTSKLKDNPNGNKDLFISVDTKLDRISFNISIEKADTVEELATNVVNNKYTIEDRTPLHYGKVYLDSTSEDVLKPENV